MRHPARGPPRARRSSSSSGVPARTRGPMVTVRRPSSWSQNASTSPSWWSPMPARLAPSTRNRNEHSSRAAPSTGWKKACRRATMSRVRRGSTWCTCGRYVVCPAVSATARRRGSPDRSTSRSATIWKGSPLPAIRTRCAEVGRDPEPCVIARRRTMARSRPRLAGETSRARGRSKTSSRGATRITRGAPLRRVVTPTAGPGPDCRHRPAG